jgi:hypothetical protein
MRSIRLPRGAALAFALVLSVAACGSTPAVGNDPSSAVQAALSAVSTGGVAKLAEYTCAAKKADPLGALGASGVGSLTAAGIKPEDILAAMTMTFANVAVTEKVKTGTTATVHVTGDSVVTLDKDKMRAILKTVLAAQGQPVDDATLDTVMTAMAGQLTQTQKLDEDVNLVQEGGKWLVCDE